MKLTTCIYATTIVLLLVSCIFPNTESTNIATAEFTTKDTTENTFYEKNIIKEFKTLKMDCVGKIFFEQSDSSSLTIKGPLNLLDKIIIKNNKDELCIYFDPKSKNLNNSRYLHYYIKSPRLDKAVIKGIVSFYNDKTWYADTLELTLKGIGQFISQNIKCKKIDVNMDGIDKIILDVNCNEINTDIKGIGTVILTGKTNLLKTRNNGLGKINTKDLTINNK